MANQAPVFATAVELQRKPFGISSVGMALSAGLHAVLIAIAITTAHRAAMEQEEERQRREEMKPPAPEPFSFVPARLLKLGNEAPDTAMPQREVPALPTAPPEPDVTPEMAPDPDSAVAGARPRRSNPMEIQPRHVPRRVRRAAPSDDVNLIWDRLRQDFPEQGTWSHVQGFPDGDPNGTALDPSLVRPGDWYATQLMEFFQDRWTIPNMIAQRELARLSCKVRIALDATFRIVDYEMTQRSGNERWDASVEEVLRKLKTDRTPLPAIPSAVRDFIIANGMILTWKP